MKIPFVILSNNCRYKACGFCTKKQESSGKLSLCAEIHCPFLQEIRDNIIEDGRYNWYGVGGKKMIRKVKPLKWFFENCKIDEDNDFCLGQDDNSFVSDMIKYCGKEIELNERGMFNGYSYDEWMLEPIEEKKTKTCYCMHLK